MEEFESIEKMVAEVMTELQAVHSGTYYEPEKARKTAAKSLEIQILLAKFLASKEADGKAAKLDVEQNESDEYFAAIPAEGKKPSDALLDRAIAKSAKVREAKMAHIRAEQEYKQWLFLNSAMKEAHVFFRGLCKESNF